MSFLFATEGNWAGRGWRYFFIEKKSHSFLKSSKGSNLEIALCRSHKNGSDSSCC